MTSIKLKGREELDQLRKEMKRALDTEKKRILVCCGTGCVASGSMKVFEALKESLEANGVDAIIELAHDPHGDTGLVRGGCQGLCEMGPLVRIDPEGILYTKVKPEDCEEIVKASVVGNEIVERLLLTVEGKPLAKRDQIDFFAKQKKILLENCGEIDAENILEYIAKDGYSALEKALFDMTPEEIVDEVLASGLRGRGGAGFPTGKKWASARRQKETIRYVVCNGDEGDPGAFMDCSVMEGDPNRMIEGMIIAAIAVGAQQGFIYVRAEYPLAVKRLGIAIEQATKLGILGDNILGTDFSFNLKISQGAGAFVCGEGSALNSSIEGRRGMPRVKPPRTIEKGLFGKPTVLNNVETYANVPGIIRNGSDWYRQYGTEKSPGTKTFTLTGDICNTGLIEIPMGTTLREVIFGIGGGIRNGKKFKAVQIGGPSGGCLTENELDLPLDFDSLSDAGAIIGSGGMVVMDEDTCMVEVARFFMSFTQKESCGKCIPCREGTKRMLETLERIVNGEGRDGDIELLEELADVVSNTSLCGLGKTAPSPVSSTIRYFRKEYEEHIFDKRCVTGTCEKLARYVIDPELCRGCSKCARNCPADAISGKIKETYVIDQSACIKCGACMTACTFGAVKKEA